MACCLSQQNMRIKMVQSFFHLAYTADAFLNTAELAKRTANFIRRLTSRMMYIYSRTFLYSCIYCSVDILGDTVWIISHDCHTVIRHVASYWPRNRVKVGTIRPWMKTCFINFNSFKSEISKWGNENSSLDYLTSLLEVCNRKIICLQRPIRRRGSLMAKKVRILKAALTDPPNMADSG